MKVVFKVCCKAEDLDKGKEEKSCFFSFLRFSLKRFILFLKQERHQLSWDVPLCPAQRPRRPWHPLRPLTDPSLSWPATTRRMLSRLLELLFRLFRLPPSSLPYALPRRVVRRRQRLALLNWSFHPLRHLRLSSASLRTGRTWRMEYRVSMSGQLQRNTANVSCFIYINYNSKAFNLIYNFFSKKVDDFDKLSNEVVKNEELTSKSSGALQRHSSSSALVLLFSAAITLFYRVRWGWF